MPGGNGNTSKSKRDHDAASIGKKPVEVLLDLIEGYHHHSDRKEKTRIACPISN